MLETCVFLIPTPSVGPRLPQASPRVKQGSNGVVSSSSPRGRGSMYLLKGKGELVRMNRRASLLGVAGREGV